MVGRLGGSWSTWARATFRYLNSFSCHAKDRHLPFGLFSRKGGQVGVGGGGLYENDVRLQIITPKLK